jgi:hypothetical protein
MTVFLSYAHQDADVVEALRRNLEGMGNSVWIDQTLYGGQIWWDEILRQVREAHVFVLAVSVHSLASEACLAEAEYATAVHRPFLPVRIDDVDMTSAPKLLRDTQHIDFKANDAPSVIALAKALNSVPDSVALPDLLPPAPPTPQSYRDRYAALLGAEPLGLDDQMSYFVRLTVDSDSANSDEALELLRVLHEREDLSWKVRQRIDRFLAERATDAGASPSTSRAGGGDAPPIVQPLPIDPESAKPSPTRRHKRAWWALAAGAAALAIALVVILMRHDSKPELVQSPENDVCDVDTCSDTPIRFFVDLSDPPDQITVTLTDPYNNDVQGVDQPSARVDGNGLEWTWRAQYEDPIGPYSVSFTGTGANPIEKTFTIGAIQDGPFGVVQKAADAISRQDWEAAALIDQRIADEMAKGVSLVDEYPPSVEKHWLPYDASGSTNDISTTIVGAYIAYSDSTRRTTAQCEVWAVDLHLATMKSDAIFDTHGDQVAQELSGRHPPSDFTSFVADSCYASAHGA